MDSKLVLIVCLALFGIVQGYTLRDMMEERALRRLREFDANYELDELERRALDRLKAFHLRQQFDQGKNTDVKPCYKTSHEQLCIDTMNAWPEHEFCTADHMQEHVTKYCRYACNVDNCRGSEVGGNVKPPHPVACEDRADFSCLQYSGSCDAPHFKPYLDLYCKKSCNAC
ncbi:hypothetical protein OS493_036454 [Desmophyllum pertusum]|uniref:ShKT domain-containing protein n=1 Tax=Desmophyllum pertusum TaxID=174260 RepID=A0A9W9YI30_9CNID|nr:hypothetical protein OS493_036454 [Desmophyllum pertusum]